MSTELPRSPAARALAQRALVALLWQLRDSPIRPIVLGGLVPEILSGTDREGVPDHMGTNDLNMLVAFHVGSEQRDDDRQDANDGDHREHDDHDEEPDLGPLEGAPNAAEFKRDPKREGWRWIASIEDRAVKVEFLCDRSDVPSWTVVRPHGCVELRFLNLRGTGYVAKDFAEEDVEDVLADGTAVRVRARFAGLQGYLLAKIAALVDRRLDKDHYDLVYVLLHHKAGTGPRGAAEALLGGPFRADLPGMRARLREVSAAFGTPGDNGPAAYAKQFLLVYPETDRSTLVQDAVSAVQEFVTPLIDL